MSLATNTKSEFIQKLDKDETETKKQNPMSLNLKLVYITGLAVPPEIEGSTLKVALFKAYVIWGYLVYLPVLSGQILALFHFWGDIDMCSNNIFTLLGAFMGFMESTYVRFNSRELVELFHTFQNKVVPKVTTVGLKQKKIEIFDSATRKARLITIFGMMVYDVMITVWMVAPLIRRYMEKHNNVANIETDEKKKWLSFCYVVWFPTDITVSPYFEVMYLMQCIVYLIATGYVRSIDMTVIAMMIHISAQFDILCTASEDIDMIVNVAEEEKKKNMGNLRLLKPRTVNMCLEDSDELLVTGVGSHEDQGLQERKITHERIVGDTEAKYEEFPELTCYLAKFVQYHQAIIDFAADVNKVLGPFFLLSFSIRQFLACTMMFQVALTWGQGNGILKFVTGLAGALCQPTLFSWYGTSIIQSSSAVHKVLYECQWVHNSKIMKHYLLMIMTRSQNAVHLSACQFYAISLESYGKMINAIYAYFTLLKNMYTN